MNYFLSLLLGGLGGIGASSRFHFLMNPYAVMFFECLDIAIYIKSSGKCGKKNILESTL